MSSTGDTRWRRTGQQQQPRQNQQQGKGDPKQQAGTQRDRSHTPNRQSVSGNAWANQDKSKAGGAGGAGVATAPTRQGGGHQPQSSISSPPTALTDEQHVPLNNFNAVETKAFLKKSYKSAINANGGDEKKLLWKPQETAKAPKPAWGTRPGTMHSGRDFWVVLRNQISQMEQQNKAGG